jgi:hypothetical protein
MSSKVMKLVDPYTGKMECRVCGSVHWANLRGGGKYYRGSWQCLYGCKLPERSSSVNEQRALAK